MSSLYEIKDREILRALAGRYREIAELPEMEERKKRWKDFNALKSQKPMVLCSPEGSWIELLPESELKCSNPKLREWEEKLRQSIYHWENIKDDQAREPWFDLNWVTEISGFGVEVHAHQGVNRGSFKYVHPITDIEKDIEKLQFRQIKFDKNATENNIELANDIFGDLLPIRIRGGFWWTLGMTIEIIKLIGLENLMLFMYDDPDNLHRLMAWMRDEHLHYITTLENSGLLTLNNESDGIASGGIGNTDELPGEGWKEGSKVLLKNLWGFAESQETVGISPEMFAEFILPYQMPLMEKFGLNCYGCCEPIQDRWDYIKHIKNLRRVSISPWCNQEIMAEKLGKNYIYSRKPHPSLVCTGFDESEIRKDLRKTFDLTKNGVVEVILKDTHTVQNKSWRLGEWVRIAKEEAEK